jgi:hypothetical protein
MRACVWNATKRRPWKPMDGMRVSTTTTNSKLMMYQTMRLTMASSKDQQVEFTIDSTDPHNWTLHLKFSAPIVDDLFVAHAIKAFSNNMINNIREQRDQEVAEFMTFLKNEGVYDRMFSKFQREKQKDQPHM